MLTGFAASCAYTVAVWIFVSVSVFFHAVINYSVAIGAIGVTTISVFCTGRLYSVYSITVIVLTFSLTVIASAVAVIVVRTLIIAG